MFFFSAIIFFAFVAYFVVVAVCFVVAHKLFNSINSDGMSIFIEPNGIIYNCIWCYKQSTREVITRSVYVEYVRQFSIKNNGFGAKLAMLKRRIIGHTIFCACSDEDEGCFI